MPCGLFWLLVLGFAGSARLLAAAAHVFPVPVPEAMRSAAFHVELDGKPVDVAHAAASYDYVNFDMTGPVVVSITAAEKGFWDKGVDVQPWRLGIRPVRDGETIRFRIEEPEKLSITRPGDFLNHAQMLFVFAGRPPGPAPAGAHVVASGVHRESLNPKSGETWYLEPGAVIFGSINLWKVDSVKVLGRGVVVYEGAQNPENDEGWMQKPDWHCIGSLEAHHIEIQGLTCLVRSRTWSIQMKDSTGFLYDDLRVIGGNPGNANQDGMDWLGGGVTIVRDSFFRASDDVLAMQGNWDGYEHDELVKPGQDIGNILVERSEFSTSISNIVRAGWPEKSYNSYNFTLRDSDVLHSGIGSCGLPFALFTFWGAKGADGSHSGFRFENIRLDDWYSLFQMEKEVPGLDGIAFRNIWALDQPPLVGSLVEGQVRDVTLANIKYGQAVVTAANQVPLTVAGGAPEPKISGGDAGVRALFEVRPKVLEPGQLAEFTAMPVKGAGTGKGKARYTWFFGDGSTGAGIRVRHRYGDAEGTELDGHALGAGRFRVLLKVEGGSKSDGPEASLPQDWASEGVIVVGRWREAQAAAPDAAQTLPGLLYQIYPGSWPDFPDLGKEIARLSGVAAVPSAADGGGFTRYAASYDGLIEVPADGGYSFDLMARDGARLRIDGEMVAETGPPFAEVCGSPSNAVRFARGTLGLRAGKHGLRLETLETASAGSVRLMWEGPGMGLQEVPATVLSHKNEAMVVPAPGSVTGASVSARPAKERDSKPHPP